MSATPPGQASGDPTRGNLTTGDQTSRTAAAGPATSPLVIDVSFTFDTSWNIAPTGKLSGFPPGGGLATRTIEITPVHLAGLDDAEVLRIATRRAGDLALLAKAIAAADIQFSEALQARTASAS